MALNATHGSRIGILGCLLIATSCTTAPNETVSPATASTGESTAELAADALTDAADATIAIKAARPAPVLDEEDDITAELSERFAIKQQQLQMEAEETYLEGQRMFEAGRYADAVSRFEQVLSRIRYDSVGIDWGDLQTRAAEALQSAERARAREESELEVEQSKAAYERLVEEEQRDRARNEQITQNLLKDGLSAFMRNDFRDAENLANRVLERDATNMRAQRLLDDARNASRRQFNDAAVERKKDEYRRWLIDIEETRIPYADIIVGPDPEHWRNISELRTQESLLALRTSLTPADKELQARLRSRKIPSIAFPGVTVEEAIQAVSVISEVPIVLDYEVAGELDSAGIELNIPELSDLSVESVLDILLSWASSEDMKLVHSPQSGVVLVTSQAKAQGQSIPRVHSIQDLTFQLTDFKGPQIGYIPEPGAEFDEENPLFGTDEAGTQIVEPEEIVNLVRDNIASDTWDTGNNSIDVTENRALMVINSPEVQLEVARFLDDLRRFSSEVVTVESRFVNIDRAFLQEIGVDFRGLGGSTSGGTEAFLNDVTSGLEDNAGLALSNNGPGILTGQSVSPVAGAFFNDGSDGDIRAFTQNFFASVATNGDPMVSALGSALSSVGGASLQVALFKGDSEYNAVIRAVEKSLNATEVEAPIVTVYNRERAYLTVVNQITFIQDFDVDVANSAFIANPNIGVIQEGVVLDVRPTISHDRKYVTLEVHATVAELLRPIREFTTSLAGFTIPVTFQLPELEVQQAETTVRVPDGGSLVIGGLKRLRYVNRTAEVPWLGRIPLVGVLFQQKGFDDEADSLIVLMKVNITSLDPWR